MEKRRIKIEEIERKNFYETPDGYFDTLPGEIQRRIPANNQTPGFAWKWGGVLTAATLVALVVSLFWLTIPKRQTLQFGGMLSNVSDATIIGYLEDEGSVSYDELSNDPIVQNAFDADSTIMNYFDSVDDQVIREQLEDELGTEISI